MLRAVLFDAAGTLIRPHERVGEVYARAARAHGVELPAWRVQDAFARVLRGAPEMAFPDATPGEIPAHERAWWREIVRQTFRAADGSVVFDDFEAFFDGVFAHYARSEAWTTLPGARDALQALRARGLRTGLVSNFDGRLPAILEGLGLAPLFDVVVLPRDAGAAKPTPRIFLHALERLGVAPADAVYVGDHAEHDVAGALGAGLRAIDVGALATLAELPHVLDAMQEDSRP